MDGQSLLRPCGFLPVYDKERFDALVHWAQQTVISSGLQKLTKPFKSGTKELAQCITVSIPYVCNKSI